MSGTPAVGGSLHRSIAAYIILILALPLVSLWSTYQIRSLSARIVAVEESRIQIQRELRYAIDEETSVRGFVNTRDAAFLEPYYSARPALAALLVDMPSQFRSIGLDGSLPLFHDFAQLHSAWIRNVAMPLIAAPHRHDAVSLQRTGKNLMDKMRVDALAMQDNGAAVARATARRTLDVTVMAATVAGVWVLLVGFAATMFERRASKRENDLMQSIVREREEVERLSEWRSRLLAMLAHDFKSRLGVLVGAAHLLEDFPERRGDTDMLTAIRTAGYSLSEMADNAILLARAQERKLALHRTQFDARDVVESVIAQHGNEREIVFRACSGQARVYADRAYVSRVVDNLISNAVKYSDGPINVDICVDADNVEIAIADRGAGISPEDLPNIFKEYWRSPGAISDRTGSGIGLFIVKTVVEAHGGSISVDSELGKGTTVTLRLPCSADCPALTPA